MSSIRIEAENLSLNGYFIENGNFASEGKYISLLEPGNLTPGATGTASYQFAEAAGKYDIIIGYYDENDGIGQLELDIDNVSIANWNLDENTGSGNASNKSFRTQTIQGVQLNPNQTITLKGTASSPAGEWARIDFIEFIPVVENLPSAGSISFSNANFSVNEDGTPIQTVELVRTDGSNGDVSVVLNLSDGSASSTDYNNSPITINFADGEVSKTVTVPIIDDSNNEANETINLSLVNPTGGATLGNQNTALLTIVDNDNQTVVSFPPAGETIIIEAETMNLTNYLVESGKSPASGNKLISLWNSGNNQGSAVTQFTGVTGNYDVEIGYFDESDGQANLSVQIGADRSNWNLNQNLGSGGVSNKNLVQKQIFTNLEIVNGQTISIAGTANQAEWARVDYIKFIPVVSNSEPLPTVAEPIRLEAEDIISNGYVIESNNVASNNKLVSLFKSGNSQGSLSTLFNGADGNYKVKIGYYDENDGQSTLTAQIGNNIYNLNLDQNLGKGWATSQTFVEFTLDENIAITQGENITLTGTADRGEWARVDYIEFIPLETNTQPPASATNGDDLLVGDSQNNTIDALDGHDVIKPGAGNNVIDGGLGIDTVSYDYDTAGVVVDLSLGFASRKFTTADDQPLKILPLGDSNTRGYPNNSNIGGYRTNLWTDLAISKGFNLDFVGKAASGPSNIDRDHEGRGGLTIDELTDNVNGTQGFNNPGAPIYTNIEDALSDRPNMVLLMAGTNDLLQGDSVNNALSELGTLVDRITADSPHTNVLVASVIPNKSNSSIEAKTAEFSNRVESEIVNPRSDRGDNVTFVDIFNVGLNNSDFSSDGIHLNQSGYDKLADVWSEAILNTHGGEDTLTNIENIVGSAYNDTLTGDAGDNVIDGRDGSDRLEGGRGDDILTGGLGSDLFILATGDGTDTIIDFEIGQDSLGLFSGLNFEQLVITQGIDANANNSLIHNADNNELLAILHGVQADSLSFADFTSIA